ncbi:hypothetical protein FGG08_001671 [Glutinoglossum americanum]|uniref:Uncharacterized protein n=1 Tax=Glutinoglossum americanum TaxID=1670608 RepID=A0A9P8L531_9PEZI|nr:hypothetical protein FGG08_001671 [Glutinoglossum americanum]
MASEVQDMQSAPFIKQLVANDKSTRDKAVASLRTYLSGRRTFTELELLKLWKGLFFCMWMSDRVRTQQRLAADLAALVDVLPSENALPFLRVFWITIAREWTGIDVLRMDKFLLLVRRYLASSFRYLAKRHWNGAVVEEYMVILSSIPLSTTEMRIPNGLRYHTIDIYVDELDKADTPRSGNLPIDTLLSPLRSLSTDSPTKAVRLKSKESLGDVRLNDWNNAERAEQTGEVERGDQGEEWGGIDD